MRVYLPGRLELSAGNFVRELAADLLDHLDGVAVTAPPARDLDVLAENLLVLDFQIPAHRVVVKGAGPPVCHDVESREVAARGAPVSNWSHQVTLTPSQMWLGPIGASREQLIREPSSRVTASRYAPAVDVPRTFHAGLPILFSLGLKYLMLRGW
jgi:hypothetical protein